MCSDAQTTAPHPPAGGPPDLGGKVAYLSSLCGPGDEAIETHFAWVFLIGDRALKLRKPVCRDTMDYRTLAARHADAESDLRLNRRLAPDVYLRTVRLVLGCDGRLSLDAEGETVEWLVEMRRLDSTLFLDVALARGTVVPAQLDRVARVLARFYASADPVRFRAGELPHRLQLQASRNVSVLETLDARRSRRLADIQQRALDALAARLDDRASRGCVVEGHGDLRPEHVHLSTPPAIIDCLEFDRDLRIMDRAEELCVLELECARIRQAGTGRRLLDSCLQCLGDHPCDRLLDFYRSHRAAHRARLYAWRAAEPDGPPDPWYARARAYLDTALAAAERSAR
jgi:aminoglycoside phosphotransferase family enzyme